MGIVMVTFEYVAPAADGLLYLFYLALPLESSMPQPEHEPLPAGCLKEKPASLFNHVILKRIRILDVTS